MALLIVVAVAIAREALQVLIPDRHAEVIDGNDRRHLRDWHRLADRPFGTTELSAGLSIRSRDECHCAFWHDPSDCSPDNQLIDQASIDAAQERPAQL
jgi:hypothetical protein